MKKRTILTPEQFAHLLNTFLAQAQTLAEVTEIKFAIFAGMSVSAVHAHLVGQRWSDVTHAWALTHLRRAMDELSQQAATQEDFSLQVIASRVGIEYRLAGRLLQDEWRIRRAALPTSMEYFQQKVLATLQTLVDQNFPLSELTQQRVMELAGFRPTYVVQLPPWFSAAYHSACLELARKNPQHFPEPPPGRLVRRIPGGWIDPDSDHWVLPPDGRTLRRDLLRQDFRGIAWAILREELLSGTPLGTVDSHYYGFRGAGEFLDAAKIPDFRKGTLEQVQQAWIWVRDLGYNRQRKIKAALARLVDLTIPLAANDPEIDPAEMRRIGVWLQGMAKVTSERAGEDFLSEAELNAVLEACLVDIKAGMEFTEVDRNLLALSTQAARSDDSSAVFYWGVALMILVMGFTGLRRQSIVNLTVDDWTEIYPGLCAIAWWRHTKKMEENAAVLPSVLAQYLDLYVHRTAAIRSSLGTKLVFLVGHQKSNWQTLQPTAVVGQLAAFIQRHQLTRAGQPFPFSCTILRRTYTTRSLYSGSSIQALQKQLGHSNISTTLRYAKQDLVEHPAQVQKPLDEYGRKVLTIWQKPLLLENLATEERLALLAAKTYHQQDVGLCRHDACVKATQGPLTPCSLCEHLVTGPDFLPAWQTEYIQREQDLQLLASQPESTILFGQMKAQFERFTQNLQFVREASHV